MCHCINYDVPVEGGTVLEQVECYPSPACMSDVTQARTSRVVRFSITVIVGIRLRIRLYQ